MKTLVVFYSRTGNTRKVALKLAKTLECDIEELVDTQKRSGILGYLRSGRQASKKELTVLEDVKYDPSQYDLIIIGTPVWGGNMSTPTRTYIHHNHSQFKEVAFFCTAGGKGFDNTFQKMAELTNKTPLATMGVRSKDAKKDDYGPKIAEFKSNLKV